jgi:hypothetical protein
MAAEFNSKVGSAPQLALYATRISTVYFGLGTLDLLKEPLHPAAVNTISSRASELNGKE